MAVRTFPFEVTTNEGIKLVDARPTRHPSVVIHRKLFGKGWTVTHGPTGSVIHSADTIKEANALANRLAELDPDGEILQFVEPQPGSWFKVFPSKWIPIEAWDVFMIVRGELGLKAKRHPLYENVN